VLYYLCHHALIAGDRKGAILGTLITIFALIFTGLQYIEYCELDLQ